ncbi:MAG: MarR family transcriptional regulator [Deltaproteobacteria bacterium]|nr:MarR family transcriptional regulator [Deltaproteobacteria bacterium]
MLRLCHAEVQHALDEGFAARDLPRLQGTVTQPLFDHAAGLRLTELAQLAGISKQAMAEAVDAMEAAGYVERIADPDDGRARRIRLTRRGRDAGFYARQLVREVEARWEARVGKAKVTALRETLRAIADARPARAERD